MELTFQTHLSRAIAKLKEGSYFMRTPLFGLHQQQRYGSDMQAVLPVSTSPRLITPLMGTSSRHSAFRRNGALWGQTEPIPTEHVTASRVSPDNVLVGDKSRAVETHEDGHPTTASTNTHTRLAASAVTPAADRNENSPETVAATAVGEPKGNPTEPERTSGNSSKQDEREGLEQSGGRASGRRGVRQRQKKTVVVREVKLAPASKSGTAAAAAVLLTDGSLWWVPDLQVGTWERVTVSVGDAAVADGVTETDFLSSASVSAIAVVGLSPGDHHPGGKKTTASDGGGESVGGKIDGGDRGSGDEVAIVAGRDDGWLMLLSQSPSRPAVDADGRKRHRPPSQPRAWCVRAAWKGHRSRVTAAWAVSDAAQRRSSRSSAGESQAFSAALETSRFSNGCAGGGFDGVLVSAGGDGTVAWWEWACAEESQNMVHTRDSGDMAIPAPRLRMVSWNRHKLAWTERLERTFSGSVGSLTLGDRRPS